MVCAVDWHHYVHHFRMGPRVHGRPRNFVDCRSISVDSSPASEVISDDHVSRRPQSERRRWSGRVWADQLLIEQRVPGAPKEFDAGSLWIMNVQRQRPGEWRAYWLCRATIL